MTYQTVLINLYSLLIHADGQIRESEIALGSRMARKEGIDLEEFKLQLVLLKSRDASKIYSECMGALKNLEREKQVRCIAWLCLAANGDGFMDRKEWQFIYGIYHKELGLPLEEIMAKQKELNIVPRAPHSVSSIPIL
jgi:uncharacterized tellurite resistance protein B-like protein